MKFFVIDTEYSGSMTDWIGFGHGFELGTGYNGRLHWSRRS